MIAIFGVGVANVSVGCTIVGILLAQRRHADARMDVMQTALGALAERVAKIEGMLFAFGHTPEPTTAETT